MAILAATSTFICTFLRSGVIGNNDLGWRGFIPAQFVLLLWAIDIFGDRERLSFLSGVQRQCSPGVGLGKPISQALRTSLAYRNHLQNLEITFPFGSAYGRFARANPHHNSGKTYLDHLVFRPVHSSALPSEKREHSQISGLVVTICSDRFLANPADARNYFPPN